MPCLSTKVVRMPGSASARMERRNTTAAQPQSPDTLGIWAADGTRHPTEMGARGGGLMHGEREHAVNGNGNGVPVLPKRYGKETSAKSKEGNNAAMHLLGRGRHGNTTTVRINHRIWPFGWGNLTEDREQWFICAIT
jgi:hypothetical protein